MLTESRILLDPPKFQEPFPEEGDALDAAFVRRGDAYMSKSSDQNAEFLPDDEALGDEKLVTSAENEPADVPLSAVKADAVAYVSGLAGRDEYKDDSESLSSCSVVQESPRA